MSLHNSPLSPSSRSLSAAPTVAVSGFLAPVGHMTGKLFSMHWGLICTIALIAAAGISMLYSVTGAFEPWAIRQIVRFGIGLVVLFIIASVPPRSWLSLALPVYILALLLLVVVEFSPVSPAQGAVRWIRIGSFQFQPSELMKLALILILARYYHVIRPDNVSRVRFLVVPLILTALPVALILRQPDLGTGLLMLAAGITMMFIAGVSYRYFAAAFGAGLAALPIVWGFLRPYQQDRLLVFINPERDPLGAGYHILQSKIAFGSGGLSGRGFLQGTQSHLSFLPEIRTDFIFTMIAEEFGFIGGLTLLALYGIVLAIVASIALHARSQFARLAAMGIGVTFFLYVFVNAAMVMGLVPVVGAPLPLVSYGGSSMITLMAGFGLVMSFHIHRDHDYTLRGYRE